MKRTRAEDGESTLATEPTAKAQKLEPCKESSPVPSKQERRCVIHIVEKKISSAHLSHLKAVARRKAFTLAASINEAEITHIVTALPSFERFHAAIACLPSPTAEVVTLEWLTTSFVEGSPTQVTDRYRLKKSLQPAEIQESSSTQTATPPFQLPGYECQRPTPLSHHNHQLTDALELLERHYMHMDYKQGDTRALAFRQASCVLKALPRKVEHVEEVSGLHRIGQHSLQIIGDILRNGFSSEVEDCQKSEWFQCMELFSAVYGCGSATANKWYNRGLRSIEDVKNCAELELTELQKHGLQYHEHISVPVSREETEMITRFISDQAQLCCPGTLVEAVGGYRRLCSVIYRAYNIHVVHTLLHNCMCRFAARGKSHGHDIDLLLTHSDPNVAESLLKTLLHHLQSQGVILHSDVSTGLNTSANVFHDHSNTASYTPDGKRKRVKFDHLDKAFCIVLLKPSHKEKTKNLGKKVGQREKETTTDPLIRRVDLIVSPPDQYPFALVSWTGSKQFNRSLRRYSVKECNMSVTAHGIYDIAKGKFVPAQSEEDVFSILNLSYLPPSLRNC